jgi:hypothetical protein
VTRASAKRERGAPLGGASEEEKGAMLKYVLNDLGPELYIEFFEGFHK